MTDVSMSDAHAPDVVDALTQDHHEALDLLARIGRTTDAGERRELADTVIAEVVRHSVAEEMFVYPAMSKNVQGGEDTVAHDKDEHAELERIMKDLEGADAADAQFMELVATMSDALAHHASDEETTQFPKLRAALDEETLVGLRRKVETAKKAAPTRPHPDAPNAALFHKTVGPGVGLVDRLRDKLSGRGTD